MRTKKTVISLAAGSAIAATLAATPLVLAAENPFSLQSLGSKGYMVMAYADRVDPNKYGGSGKSAEGRCGMSRLDADKDGKVTKQEFLKYHESVFDQIDANKDGAVDQLEADGFGKSQSPATPAAPGTAPHAGTKK